MQNGKQTEQQQFDKGPKAKFSLLTYKNINFSYKIKGRENKRNEEQIKNVQLKQEIKNFDSDSILESIARNNLKMAGEDEILIIINKPEEKNDEDIKVKNKKRNKK